MFIFIVFSLLFFHLLLLGLDRSKWARIEIPPQKLIDFRGDCPHPDRVAGNNNSRERGRWPCGAPTQHYVRPCSPRVYLSFLGILRALWAQGCTLQGIVSDTLASSRTSKSENKKILGTFTSFFYAHLSPVAFYNHTRRMRISRIIFIFINALKVIMEIKARIRIT